MTDTLKIKAESVTTRSRARDIAEHAASEGYQSIDFATVEFVSRSVADEFVHQAEKHNLELQTYSGPVTQMIDAVQKKNPVTA